MSDNEREPIRVVGFDGTTIDIHFIPDGPPLVLGKDFFMGDRYPALSVSREAPFEEIPPMAMAISIAEQQRQTVLRARSYELAVARHHVKL